MTVIIRGSCQHRQRLASPRPLLYSPLFHVNCGAQLASLVQIAQVDWLRNSPAYKQAMEFLDEHWIKTAKGDYVSKKDLNDDMSLSFEDLLSSMKLEVCLAAIFFLSLLASFAQHRFLPYGVALPEYRPATNAASCALTAGSGIGICSFHRVAVALI